MSKSLTFGDQHGLTYSEGRRKVGRPLENFKDADEMKQVFELYLEFMEGKVRYKSEVIKGGDLAGQIIQVPIYEMLTVESFCLFAGISKGGFFYEMLKPLEKSNLSPETHAEFKDVAAYVKDYIDADQLAGGAAGVYTPSIVMRKLNLTENVNSTVKGDKENPVAVIPITGMQII